MAHRYCDVEQKNKNKLVGGELQIAEDEAEAIRIIFDKFTHTNMGYTGVVKYLAQQGISKKARQNGHLTRFSVSTVKAILDNPVYCGKIAYGRRKTEKIEGTRIFRDIWGLSFLRCMLRCPMIIWFILWVKKDKQQRMLGCMAE